MPPVQLLIKPVSGDCNLRCRYCFYEDEMNSRRVRSYGRMSSDTLEAVVRRAFDYAQGSCGFAFQGGEPTLAGLSFYREFLELAERYNVNRLPVPKVIQTNGCLISEEWASFLSQNGFLVGLSLDGTKYTHDAYRLDGSGQGTFAEVMRAAGLFDRYHVEYNILTTVTNRVAQKIARIYAFYERNGWKYLQFIACLDPLGEPPGGREYSLTPEAYGDFLVELFDLWYLDWQKGKQPYIRLFENYISLLLGQLPEACEQNGYCSIQYVVEADGTVYPCDFYALDEYRLGNIREDSIPDLRGSRAAADFCQSSLQNKEGCRRCEYSFLCRGGCRRNRVRHADGSLGSSYFCRSYRQLFEAALPRMQLIAACLQNEPDVSK